MQALLAGCDGPLMAYDPIHYRRRSSGLLWCYGAARLMSGRLAAVVGHEGSWLQRDAQDLGLHRKSVGDGSWLEGLAALLEQGSDASSYTHYGRRMLGEAFAEHVAQSLLGAEVKTKW